MADSRDITGKNRKFTGTGSITLPKGTEAQRLSFESGEIRFNTDINLAEYYDGTDWKPIDAPPTITGFSIDGGAVITSGEVTQLSGDATVVISGSNFDVTSGTVVFEPESGGANVTTQTITRTNSSSFTVTVTRTDFDTANDPYAIKLINGSGLAATLASALVVNDTPVFTTAADTTVTSKYEGQSAPFSETTLAATDPESDAITYSISAGSLPPGITINSSTAALEGTISGSSIQNYTFTVQAATAKGNSTRQFIFEVVANPFISATGGTVLTSGDYKTHIFTSSSSFVVSSAGTPTGANTVEYLVVAGGGSGASGDVGGGGGAGGMRYNYPSPATGGLSVSATTYPVTVGGGASGVPNNVRGNNGQNSVFSNITSAGGGGGGVDNNPPGNGKPGGSGGGGGWGTPHSGGSGNQPPVSPPQGQPGGNNPPGTNGPAYIPGGGGGHSQAGYPGGYPGGYNPGDRRGRGGDGTQIANTFFGPTAPSYGTPGPSGRYFAGGGGACSDNDNESGAPGGSGGGGKGGSGPGGAAPVGGTANTGGGSGGGAAQTTGNGGTGIVAIRYKFQ